MKKICMFSILFVVLSLGLSAQNVGIGTSAPAYKLDVAGNIHSSSTGFFDGYLGVNTNVISSFANRIQVNDGGVALYNTTDAKTWLFNYSNSGNYCYFRENGIDRVAFANGGNVGIGTSSPAFKLDVNGAANIATDLTVGDNIKVNGNKGIVSSWNGTQQKYYTQQSSVHAILSAFGTSAEGTIAWPSGIFTNPPKIFVGDIVSTGGTVGQLFRVQLVTYDATADNCHFRLINTSNGSVDYSITWNIVLLGN